MTIQIETIFSGESNWILRGIRLVNDNETKSQRLSLLLACDLICSPKEYHAWELSDALERVPGRDRLLKADFDLEDEVVDAEVSISVPTTVQLVYGDRALKPMDTYPDDYIERDYVMVAKTVADAEDFLQQESDFKKDFDAELDKRLGFYLSKPD